MEDYITWLLSCLEMDPRAKAALIPKEYLAQRRVEKAAFEALSSTFSEEQWTLYLEYEPEHNALSSMDADWAARRAFLLAQTLYR